jgi:LPXTG-motif cell wall-anchored protein
MTETKPADGYTTAESIQFTVSDTGDVQKVTMKDDTTKVLLSKKTLTGSDELEGCQLQVTDKNGNVIDSWTSTNEAHLIEGKLVVGETYTMTETRPADGYVTAESIDFEVLDTGTDRVQSVTMTDDTTKVLFSKTTLTGSDELEGCQLEVTDKNGNVIDSWTSTNEAHLIEGKLIVGETYTMTETKPADGYTTAESIQFTVSDTGEMQKVEMADDTTKVEFAKIAKDTNKNLAKAKLQLKDTDGNEIETWITTDDTHYIEGKLVAGKTYILSEISAPNGYEKAEDVKFTVNTDGTKQTVTMVDEKTPVDVSLPTTGGNSTLPLFFALGLSMMMAGIFIFCRAKTKD